MRRFTAALGGPTGAATILRCRCEFSLVPSFCHEAASMPSCFLRQDQRAWKRMLSALQCHSLRPNLSSSTAIRAQFCPRLGSTSRSPKGLWAVRVGAGRSQYNDVVITLPGRRRVARHLLLGVAAIRGGAVVRHVRKCHSEHVFES